METKIEIFIIKPATIYKNEAGMKKLVSCLLNGYEILDKTVCMDIVVYILKK